MCRTNPENNAKVLITALILKVTEGEDRNGYTNLTGLGKKKPNKNNTTILTTSSFSRGYVTKFKSLILDYSKWTDTIQNH